MIKATATGKDGRTKLVIGLSFKNLERFRAQPGDTFIDVDGRELGMPVDVVIFSCETEAAGADLVAQFVGPKTKVTVSPKLKQ